MSHMSCSKCEGDMWDGDGHIVYDIYKKDDFIKYINQNGDCIFDKLYGEYTEITEDGPNIWLCDNCHTAHVESYNPKHCNRNFELVNIPNNLDLEKIKLLDEYFIFNLNDDYYDNLLTDIIKENPIRPYKYYIEDDLSKVYIINTQKNEIDRVYELKFESFAEYDIKIEGFDNLLIYTIYKTNDEHSYMVKNGKRIQKDLDDFPHRQVNFMIREKGENGKETISYADPNREPELYTSKNMNIFYEKYGKYFTQNKKDKD